MHRRQFIRNTGLGMTGILLHPNMSLNKDIVLGHNNKQYRLDTKWSQADVARYPVKDCHEMVQDQKGRILLLTNEAKNNVLIYDKKGRLLQTWGTDYPGAHG